MLSLWPYTLLRRARVVNVGILSSSKVMSLALSGVNSPDSYKSATEQTNDEGQLMMRVLHLKQQGKLMARVPKQCKKMLILIDQYLSHANCLYD
jgi:hypothetical protein